MTAKAIGNQPHWGRVLGWAAYLACSWTWCIGMFLPVLLVRDYGVWGFVVFAVPNCLGAAVSGIAMARWGPKQWFIRAHLPAAFAFSLVTMAFQAFFAGWMTTLLPPPSLAVGALLLAMTPLLLRPARGHGSEFVVAFVALGFTAFAMATNLITGQAEFPGYVRPFDERLGAIAPVCAFGFALCPYLDLTFWRVGGSSPGRSGRAAFLIGFLLFFPLSIAFTLAYAGRLGDAEEFASLRAVGNAATGLLGGYLFIQLWATMIFHAKELTAFNQAGEWGVPRLLARGAPTKVVLLLGAATLGAAGARLGWYHGLAFNEVVYRIFMGAYGLVFPAYVWLCVMPTWRRSTHVVARNVRVWAGACTIAAPMFWMGFIERREIWLFPAMAVVVLARLLVVRPPPPIRKQASEEPPEPSGAPVPVHSGPPTLGAHAIPGREPPEYPGSP